MRWRYTETPTFAGSAGSAAGPAKVGVFDLLDRDGNVLFTFTKAVDGTFSHNLPVSPAVTAAIAAALSAAGQRIRVRAATTANITIATALNNADTLDGVTLATGDYVLVKNQTADETNGIYVVGVTPARASEFDTYDEHPGSLIIVEEGTANADTIWYCSSNAGGTLETTTITFTSISSALSSAAITAKLLTGYVSGAGTVAATDTILQAFNKLNGNIALKQPTLDGTFSLANFTDPGDATASAALAGTIGTFVFGYVTYTPDVTTAQRQTFAVETAIASGLYTTVQVIGQANNAANVGGAETVPFNFFVPTGRKWKHTATGTAAVTSVSGIAL